MQREVPDFRGTRRRELKFTAEEADAIQRAERAPYYEPEEKPRLGRLVGELIGLVLLKVILEKL